MAEATRLTVTADIADALRESVEAGEYASTDEALRDAVRVWRTDREERTARLASIRERIRQSIEDPRPSLTATEVAERLSRLHRATIGGHGEGEA